VSGISVAELQQLTRTRCRLEQRALRDSLANATEVWEARHRDFHNLLVGPCGRVGSSASAGSSPYASSATASSARAARFRAVM